MAIPWRCVAATPRLPRGRSAKDETFEAVSRPSGTGLRCGPTCPSTVYKKNEWDVIDDWGLWAAALSGALCEFWRLWQEMGLRAPATGPGGPWVQPGAQAGPRHPVLEKHHPSSRRRSPLADTVATRGDSPERGDARGPAALL